MQPFLYYGMTYSVRFFDVIGDISRFNSNFVRYSAIMRAVNNRQWKQGHYYVGLKDGGIQLDVTDATRVELDWFGFAGVWESIIYDPTDKLVKINGRASVSKKKASTMVWGDYHLTYCKHIRNHYYICDLD